MEIGEWNVSNKVIDEVQELEPPRTKPQLRSFLGMCNFYRNFVKDVAIITAPLNKLLTKKASDRSEKQTDGKQTIFDTQTTSHITTGPRTTPAISALPFGHRSKRRTIRMLSISETYSKIPWTCWILLENLYIKRMQLRHYREKTFGNHLESSITSTLSGWNTFYVTHRPRSIKMTLWRKIHGKSSRLTTESPKIGLKRGIPKKTEERCCRRYFVNKNQRSWLTINASRSLLTVIFNRTSPLSYYWTNTGNWRWPTNHHNPTGPNINWRRSRNNRRRLTATSTQVGRSRERKWTTTGRIDTRGGIHTREI